jgi:hypothetical protein
MMIIVTVTWLQMHTEEELSFFQKVFERSGLSLEGTYLPAAINPLYIEDKPQTGE